MIFLPIVNIMTKKYKTRSRTRGGARRKKKRHRRGAATKRDKSGRPFPQAHNRVTRFVKSLLNFALIIPEEAVNIVYGAYTKFMRPFSLAVIDTVKSGGRALEDPEAILEAMERVMKTPVFQTAWAETVSEIFDVLLIPVIPKLVDLIEVLGLDVVTAVAKILGKGAYTIGQTIATSLEAAMSAVPGVGTVLDILTIVQGFLSAFSTLTIQSLKIITKIIISVLSVAGLTIEPLLEIAPGMYQILYALFMEKGRGPGSIRTTRKTRKKGDNSSLTRIGVET